MSTAESQAFRRYNYSALIRTFNSEATLPSTLAALERQTVRPSQYIIVDSGSSDATLALLPRNSIVHRYVGAEFNYSEAINQGLGLITDEFVLIVSSHTSIDHPAAISYALEELRLNNNIAAASFPPDSNHELQCERIDCINFDGFNGLSNTCALIRKPLLERRNFRADVFSAEDQEWAAWLFGTYRDISILRIWGANVKYANPHRHLIRKRINEYVSVAYFIRNDLLRWKNISRVAYSALLPAKRRSVQSRRFYFELSLRLIACRFWRPMHKSKYF